MTLREVVDSALLAKAVPDEQTINKNIEFLKAAAQNMEKDQRQKMNAVIDGIKNASMFAKAKKNEEEEQRKEQELAQQKPQQQQQKQAQVSQVSQTAQNPSTSQTAQ